MGMTIDGCEVIDVIRKDGRWVLSVRCSCGIIENRKYPQYAREPHCSKCRREQRAPITEERKISRRAARHQSEIFPEDFGGLTALSYDPVSNTYSARCNACGKSIVVSACNIKSQKSCGCLQKDAVKSLYVDSTAPSKLHEGDGRPRSNNASGVTGVWRDNAREAWAAEIMFQRKKYFLGRYEKIEDAISARKTAEEKIFGDFLKWYDETHKK